MLYIKDGSEIILNCYIKYFFKYSGEDYVTICMFNNDKLIYINRDLPIDNIKSLKNFNSLFKSDHPQDYHFFCKCVVHSNKLEDFVFYD